MTPELGDVAQREADLLAQAAAGNEDAVTSLFATYAGPLYGFALRRLGDEQLAEELVQTVLTRLWRAAERFDPHRASVRTWVFAIARNAVVDLHRRRPPEDLDADPGGIAEPDDELERLLRAEAVRAALERLSEDHREVLELAYFQGLSQREVAARLRLPLGTVKSRTYYALRAFGLACEELGVTP